MKYRVRVLIIMLLICLTVGSTTVSASAADLQSAQDVLMQSVAQAVESASPEAPQALKSKTITNVLFLSAEQIDAISDLLSKEANVYLVELQDGRQTYYMTIDLRDDNAVYYSNLFVLRSTSRKLLHRSEEMARAAAIDNPALMDYRHIVGELAVHIAGYQITGIFGGDHDLFRVFRPLLRCGK